MPDHPDEVPIDVSIHFSSYFESCEEQTCGGRHCCYEEIIQYICEMRLSPAIGGRVEQKVGGLPECSIGG